MRRILMGIGLISLFVLTCLTTLFILLKHTPSYYRSLELPESIERQDRSGQFLASVTELFNQIQNNDPKWGIEFTSEELNSYFQEGFRNVGGDSSLPTNFYDPRIVFEDDRIKIGIRYREGLWSTIVTLEFRIWLVTKEVNCLALELIRLDAGAISLSSNLILDYIDESARRNNMSVQWYRYNGNAVAILHYQVDQLLPTLIIERFDFVDGKCTISGSSTESGE